MSYHTGLAQQAVRVAASLRARYGIGPTLGLCPYDFAIKKLEIKVSFIAAPSLEGMYSPEPKPASIILSSERPAGRRRYTCAHELGHHIFEHGTRIDELEEGKNVASSAEEFLAQRFASALLMPKIAVDAAFTRRGWRATTSTPEQMYVVSQELGVGYIALITNAEINLKVLSQFHADTLRSAPIAKVRAAILGQETKGDVFFVDQHWIRPTVDVEIGDYLVLPQGSKIEGICATDLAGTGTKFSAVAPGIAGVSLAGAPSTLTLRVSKRHYSGLARYRHLEEVNDNE